MQTKSQLDFVRAHSLPIRKQPVRLDPDNRRVITRMLALTEDRIRNIVTRVLDLPEEAVRELYQKVLEDYGSRHRRIEETFRRHFEVAESMSEGELEVSEERRLLIGSYLTMEYAIESAALFNPSIVPHPDQSNLPEGAMRVILSLRAVGEGHLSSVEFRSAIIDSRSHVEFEPMTRYVAAARVFPDRHYDKHLFFLKVFDMTLYHEPSALDIALRVAGKEILEEFMKHLGDRFTLDELKWFMGEFKSKYRGSRKDVLNEVFERMLFLARSNYEIRFSDDTNLSERVIFPVSLTEAGGIEDARFVRFIDDDGETTYYATYTAYDRQKILTQFLETPDFKSFKIHTLNGKFAQSKGMALFPRRIKGKYAMISRIDGESLFLMYSDNIHFWDKAIKLQIPIEPWEITHIGNCGSPIETEAGWILLTHGVGPMRRYCIGVALLDLEDPSKILGELPEPLLSPEQDEREGYVPNVVYSCGALIHQEELVIPYAISDTATRVASVALPELLEALLESGRRMS